MEEASFLYLDRESLQSAKRPFRLRYKPKNNEPRSNIYDELKSGIVVHDVRDDHSPPFEPRGFTWTTLSSKLSHADFHNKVKVQEVYYVEIRQLLQDMFNPSLIEIVEHKTRKDREKNPAEMSKRARRKFWRRPIKVVHLDYSVKTAEDVSTSILEIPKGRYRRMQCLNIWQPLHGPVQDCHLALCDPQSVNFIEDSIPVDMVSRKITTECTQFHYHSDHRWYFLSNQEKNEIAIFRQYDSDLPNGQGVPHAAFHIARNHGLMPPRESIETRAFLYYN